ncbi:MAG: Rpn family recombination-promoting nuclease/putative transposase [Prevotellaceae bacterium]|jgi:predicted transposase/invertase (TIGR01784 family)|nr:Rpn family recombination-promoting nuclease/putative transposase [Prevotellaceae bacterium]
MAEDDENIDKTEESDDKGIFIDLKTDFGFKKTFHDNEEAVISFLNAVMSKKRKERKERIESITFLSVEITGDKEEDRHAIVDVYCRTNTEEYFIVEMQFARPMNFINRLAVYILRAGGMQVPRRGVKQGGDGEKMVPWHYEMKAIYVIAITNFPMFTSKSAKYKNIVVDRLCLISSITKNIASDIINILFVDLTRFNKTPAELKTTLDYWLYTFKYAKTLTECPKEIKDDFFKNLYDNILRTNKLNPKEMQEYRESLKQNRDLSIFTDYSRMEGIALGKAEGKAEVVLSLAENGFPAESIALFTKLSVEQVRTILRNKKMKTNSASTE